MAIEYLADNANSLATINWLLADGTAGAGFAAGGGAATLRIASGKQAITQDCDQTGATNGVESFDVLPDFTGDCGDSTHPFKFEVDGTSESLANAVSRLRYWAGGGKMWFHSSTNGCHILQVNSGGEINLVGGGYKHLHLDKGTVNFTDQTTCTASGTWYVGGGTMTLEKHASNTFNVVHVLGGGSSSFPHKFLRGGTTLNIKGGQSVLNVKNGSVTNLNIDDGYLSLLSHNATGPALTALGGTIDVSSLSRPITLSNPVLGRVTFIGFNRNMVTLSSPVYIGGGPIGLN